MPVVCGYCGCEQWAMPVWGWTFVSDIDESPFCSTECWARYRRQNPEVLG